MSRRLGLALLLLCLGCDRVFYAQLKEDSTPEQPVFQTGSNPDFSGQALVYRVTVTGRPRRLTSPDTAGSWRTFWEVVTDSAVKHIGLRELHYGMAPVGMHALVGPVALSPGYVYGCHFACSGLSPAVYFEVTATRKLRPLHPEQWRSLTGQADSTDPAHN
jgi:hypothetical protein